MENELIKPVIEKLDIGIIILNNNHEIVIWNRWLENLTGKKESDIKGRKINKLFPLFNKDLYQRYFNNVLAKNQKIFCSGSLHNQVFISTKEKEQNIKQNMQLEPLEHNGVNYILMQIIDITNQNQRVKNLKEAIAQRKKIEKEIQIKNEEQQLLLDNIETQVWYLKNPETFGKVNKAFADFVGEIQSNISDRNIQEIRQKDEAKISINNNKKVFKNKEKIETEQWLTNHKGEKRLFYITKIPKLTNQNQVEYVVCTGIDITKEKNQEEIIKQLHKVAIEFQKTDDEEAICQKTIEAASKILNFDLCHISLAKNNEFVPVAFSDEMSVKAVPLNHGIAGKAFKNNENYLTLDASKDPDAKPTKAAYKSAITVTINKYGVFQAVSNKKSAFSQHDLELAEILISHTISALDGLYHQKELQYKSFHDSLTSLYNRRFFEEEIRRLDTKRQLPLSIIMSDLNGLKIINDSFGHKKGDEILKKTANILKAVFREEDIIARQGGDEFAVLLPETNKKELEIIIERVKSKITEVNKGEEIPISIAIGSATKEVPVQNIFETLKIADDNMYQNKLSESKSSKNNIVKGLLNTLSAKSDETKEHAIRMTKLAYDFGDKLNLSNSELNRLLLLATMHDIGKSTIPENILTKPGRLNPKEWELIKKHSERGYKIASASDEFLSIAEEILAHHERWDGTGYPKSLKKQEIPYLARIISIIDAYDVMTNKRSYSEPVSKEKALEEIKECAGSQFDPELSAEFIKMMK